MYYCDIKYTFSTNRLKFWRQKSKSNIDSYKGTNELINIKTIHGNNGIHYCI